MFIPGETIIHEFIIPFKYYTIEKVIATYKQDNRVVLEKTITILQPYFNDDPVEEHQQEVQEQQTQEQREQDEMSCGCKRIPDYDVDELFDLDPAHPIIPIVPCQTIFVVELSQQETLLFDPDKCAFVQLNVFFDNGTRIASDELLLQINNQYYRQVISYDA